MEENTTTTANPAPKNNMPLIIGAVVALVVIGGGIFAFTANKNATKTAGETEMKAEMSPTQAAPTAGDAMTASPSTTMGDEQTITMEAGAFYFKPAVITAKKGQKVKIVFNSKDMVHNFNVDELGVKGPTVKSGDTSTFEFTPEKTGTFEYYCSIGQHRAKGQVGKITIE